VGDEEQTSRDEGGSFDFLEGAQEVFDNLEKKAEPEKPIELALLGLILKKNDLYFEVTATLEPSYFKTPYYQEVFREMHAQVSQRHYFDAVTLRDALRQKKEFAGLEDLFDGIEAAAKEKIPEEELSERAKIYAERIRENHYQMEFVEFLKLTGLKLDTGETPLEESAEHVGSMARKILTILRKKHKVHSMRDVLRHNFQQIEDIRDRRSRILGISTGYYEIDDAISGLQDGLLYIIGGRPGMGKTSLQTCLLENIVLKEQKPALFFSLEMGSQEISLRMLCSHARIDSNQLRAGKVTESDYQRLVFAAGALHDANLFINDDPLTINDIASLARDYCELEKIKVIMIDHLQEIKVAYNPDRRQEQVGYHTRELKRLAKELKVPVVVSSHLNRGPETDSSDNRPKLSHLRESGEIEQEADVVMLLYRDDYYNEESDMKGVVEVNIAKNRNGPTKKVDLAFLRQFTRFENLATRP
jgi:replicative DNA helicase